MSDTRLILPAHQKEFPPFVQYRGLFSPPECEAIIRVGTSKKLEYGQIGNGAGGGHVENLDYRCAKTSGIDPWDACAGSDMSWLFERLRSRVEWANRDFFRFDLHGLWERLVFLQYEPPKDGVPPGHYDWHQDFGGDSSSLRKLSLVVQLTPPHQYSGCRLRLFNSCDYDPGIIGQGDCIIFPSWTPHCVTPIESGMRHALVAWVSGPQFR